MNNITVIGRLTGDAESQQGQNGVIAHFDLADNHGKDKDGKDEVTFFRCSAWSKTAERAINTFKKGLIVSVSGTLKVRPYKDNQGQDRTSNDINVSVAGFPMVSAPNNQAPAQAAPPAQQPPQQSYGAPPQQYAQPPVGYPPQQTGYQQPPYGAPPAQGYHQPPQQTQYQQAAPPQQAPYQQPPQQQFTPPPQTPQYNQPPQQPIQGGHPPGTRFDQNGNVIPF